MPPTINSHETTREHAAYHHNSSNNYPQDISLVAPSKLQNVDRLESSLTQRTYQNDTFRDATTQANAQAKNILPKNVHAFAIRTSAKTPELRLGGQALEDTRQLVKSRIDRPLPVPSSARTQAIAEIVKGDSDPSQQRLNLNLFNRHNENRFAKNESRQVTVIGAGPTGQTQALKAYEHGLSVKVTEKRTEFSRGNIFQIKASDFNKNIGKFLSNSTISTLKELGVISPLVQNGQESIAIAINDLENILSGVIGAQSELSSGAIVLTHGVDIAPAQLSEGLDADIIIAAVGANQVRDALINQALPESSIEVVKWNNNPRGFALHLSITGQSQQQINQLQQELTSIYPEKNSFNFLPLPDQGKLQINFILDQQTFSDWVDQSPRNDRGSLDYSKYQDIHSTHIALARKLIPLESIQDAGVKDFLDQALQSGNNATQGWVNENSIDRLNTPATLLTTADRDQPVPFIFIGDAQANNWFLFGDGNPREDSQTTIVSDKLFKTIPENIGKAIADINEETTKDVLLDNTKIPGSYARTPGLSQSTDNLDREALSGQFRGI